MPFSSLHTKYTLTKADVYYFLQHVFGKCHFRIDKIERFIYLYAVGMK